MNKYKETSMLVTAETTDMLDKILNMGWKVKQMCAFSHNSTNYAKILVILYKEN
jgi:hypothetical protein